MGYDVHVTRRIDWLDHASGPPIRPEEFEAIRSLPDFEFDADLGAKYAVWKAHPERPWIEFEDGELRSKNPPREFMARLAGIAAELGGCRVVGDDGEEYGRDGEIKDAEPGDGSPTTGGQARGVPVWVQLLSVLLLGCVLGAVAYVMGLFP